MREVAAFYECNAKVNTCRMYLRLHWSMKFDDVLNVKVGNCASCSTCPSISGRCDRRNFVFFHAGSESGFAWHVGAKGEEKELSVFDYVTGTSSHCQRRGQAYRGRVIAEQSRLNTTQASDVTSDPHCQD